MSDDQGGTLHHTSDGGAAGSHPEAEEFQALVGPSTANEFNTARLPLIPVACWRVDDIRFDFDSSFVLPAIKTEMAHLASLLQQHPGAPLSTFGHADPVGNDDYNKKLSGRRAAAIYGMLTRRDEVWEDLFKNKGNITQSVPGDKWGTRSIQTMLNELGFSVAVNGEMGPETESAVKQFQNQNKLDPDGDPGPATRKALFLAYMANLSVDADGQPFQVDKKDGFLARNDDQGGKGDFQGCGEFNPLLIFSQKQNDEFEQAEDKTARNAANAPNRRVMVLLFRKGSRVDPAKWPCPRAKEGVAGCKKRFFSDGEKRRSTRLPDKPRRFGKTKDTFACRFYQRISSNSPCQSGRPRIRLLLDDPFLGFLAGVQVAVQYAGGAKDSVVSDSRGAITLFADQGDFADLEFTTSITKHSHRVFIVPAGVSTPKGAWQRLVNLGYVDSPQPPAEPPDPDVLAAAVAEFQATHGITPTGSVDSKTETAIGASHDSIVAWRDEDRKDLTDDHLSDSASLAKDDVA